MLKKIKNLFSGREESTAAVASGEEKSGKSRYWTNEDLEEMGYSTGSAKAMKISSSVIRKAMDKTGWNSYECFCRMLEIADSEKISFKEIAKGSTLAEYKLKQAENLMNSTEGRPFGIQVDRDAFERCFYSPKQKEALDELRRGIVSINTIENYLNIQLPEGVRQLEGNMASRVSFDLRTLSAGDIFICVPSKYAVPDAIKRKKPLCIIAYPSYEESLKGVNIPFIGCTNLGSYVLDITGEWKQRFDIKTIGITGSVGKTSTTDMIGSVVGSEFNMHKVIGNRNTTWQIADFVFKLKKDTQVYVQECSGSFPGQMEKSSRIVQPDIFVLTNIGNGHIGRYDGRQDRLLYEKLGLDRHAAEDATGIINKDDELLSSIKFLHKTKSFGMKNLDADFFADSIAEKDGTISFDIVEKDGTRTDVTINVVGIHNVYNALAAFAVAVELGVERSRIKELLLNFRTSGARQNLVNYGGQKLYIDCCSATEESMKSAVKAMENISVAEGARKIAVLADVQMLGDQAEEIHRRIGKMICEENHADEIIFYGHDMQYAMDEVMNATEIPCRITEDREELEKWLEEGTGNGDLITFKAGHAMGCQWVIDDIWGTNFYLHDKFTTNAPVVSEDGEQYKCIDGYGCALITANRKAKEVEIKSEVSGYPVRVIDDGVYAKAGTENVVISDTVISIGEKAFAGSKVKNITFPSGLKYIGVSAFAKCLNLEVIDLSRGCETIDADAFKDCDNLKKIILPENIRTIDESAFESDLEAEIIVKKGTFAESWAEDRGYSFKAE